MNSKNFSSFVCITLAAIGLISIALAFFLYPKKFFSENKIFSQIPYNLQFEHVIHKNLLAQWSFIIKDLYEEPQSYEYNLIAWGPHLSHLLFAKNYYDHMCDKNPLILQSDCHEEWYLYDPMDYNQPKKMVTQIPKAPKDHYELLLLGFSQDESSMIFQDFDYVYDLTNQQWRPKGDRDQVYMASYENEKYHPVDFTDYFTWAEKNVAVPSQPDDNGDYCFSDYHQRKVCSSYKQALWQKDILLTPDKTKFAFVWQTFFGPQTIIIAQ